MNRWITAVRLMLSLLALTFAVARSEAAARKWASASGQFSVEADLVEVRDGKVVLKKQNGKQITVPLDKLSAADRQYIASLAAKTPTDSAPKKKAPAARAKRPVKPKRQFTWETTERLVLPAEEAAKAKDDEVWVNDDGSHVGYIRKQGQKEQFVLDGTGEPRHDSVETGNLYKNMLFFGGGEHYAYVAEDGESKCVVVDGQNDANYGSIDSFQFYLSPIERLWSYQADSAKYIPRWIVTNGKQVFELGVFPKSGEVLLTGGHSLFIDLKDDASYAVFDGKYSNAYHVVNSESLTLHPSGAHGYAIYKKSGDHHFVVNGRESAIYLALWERSLKFSADGKHYIFSVQIRKKGGEGVVVIDGQEHSVPGAGPNTILSADGEHWACIASTKQGKVVVLDGETVASGYDELLDYGGRITFGPHGAFAFAAKKDKRSFVVLAGAEQPSFHEVSGLRFSPDGDRLAYVAELAEKGPECVVVDGKPGKSYDRVSGGTINFGLDGECLSYIVKVGTDDKNDAGFLVIDGEERTKYDRIAPKPSQTLQIGTDTLEYVAVRDGAYYWVTEKRHEK